MQLWLFFIPGAGGDGLANLLERATNVTPVDREKSWWRVHRIVNGATKFYAPTIDKLGCFRNRQPFKQHTNFLLDNYKDLVKNGTNTVVTSHDVTLSWLYNSDCLNVLTQGQIKVLLNTDDYRSAAEMCATKNLLPNVRDYHPDVDFSKFDYVLDMKTILNNWNYVRDFCQDLGLDISIDEYVTYKKIINGDTSQMCNNFNIEQYQATILHNEVTYTKTGVWQPV
jgi:hypothetical protein